MPSPGTAGLIFDADVNAPADRSRPVAGARYHRAYPLGTSLARNEVHVHQKAWHLVLQLPDTIFANVCNEIQSHPLPVFLNILFCIISRQTNLQNQAYQET